MTAREVLRYPHPSLKQVTRPLELEESELVQRVAGDLAKTMRSHSGCVGLAAPQVDELVRMIAVDVSEHPRATKQHGKGTAPGKQHAGRTKHAVVKQKAPAKPKHRVGPKQAPKHAPKHAPKPAGHAGSGYPADTGDRAAPAAPVPSCCGPGRTTGR